MQLPPWVSHPYLYGTTEHTQHLKGSVQENVALQGLTMFLAIGVGRSAIGLADASEMAKNKTGSPRRMGCMA